MIDVAAVASRVMGSTELFRAVRPKNRNLVIINKGPGAVYIKKQDGWDLAEFYFMNSDIREIRSGAKSSEADYVVFETDRNMRKFAIVKKFLALIEDWRQYDFVMIADDDLLPVDCQISDIFDLFRKTGFRVGQPALTEDSYYSHEITRRQANFVWRRTNFAEVMCPIFSSSSLGDYVEYFDSTISGFGLDVLWSCREWERHGGVAVLDATPMRHCRPVRGGVAYTGLSPEAEQEAFFKKEELIFFAPVTLSGEALSGEYRVKKLKHLNIAGLLSGAWHSMRSRAILLNALWRSL